MYKQSTPVDSFSNSGDVLALAFRPDGRELVTSALGGLLHFWDVREGLATGEISSRRDITGGRREKDLFDPRKSDVGKALTSLAYVVPVAVVVCCSAVACTQRLCSSVLLPRAQCSTAAEGGWECIVIIINITSV